MLFRERDQSEDSSQAETTSQSEATSRSEVRLTEKELLIAECQECLRLSSSVICFTEICHNHREDCSPAHFFNCLFQCLEETRSNG